MTAHWPLTSHHNLDRPADRRRNWMKSLAATVATIQYLSQNMASEPAGPSDASLVSGVKLCAG